MVKLYGSTQHCAVHLKCQQSTILNDITWRLPSQINDVRMHAPSVRVSNIVQRVSVQIKYVGRVRRKVRNMWGGFGKIFPSAPQ